MARLAFLDGLRGCCALYVVAAHANFRFLTVGDLNGFTYSLSRALGYGHSAVTIFFLISGFSLGLQVINGEPFQLVPFLKRRYWRIAPPAYALMLFAIPLAFVRFQSLGIDWAPDSKQILFNLLLQNDFYPDVELATIPLWTVAYEAKLYCSFPALVWLYCRHSAFLVLLISSALSAIACLFGYADGWYIGLFALGFLASQKALWRPKLLAIGSGFLLLILFFWFPIWGDWYSPQHYHNHLLETDLALSLFVVSLFQCRLENARSTLAERILSSSLLISLGSFSYSLYLVHEPVQVCLYALTIDLSGQQSQIALFCSAIGLSLVAGKLFYWIVEQHFLRRSPRTIAKES